jgi:hypothetical protein
MTGNLTSAVLWLMDSEAMNREETYLEIHPEDWEQWLKKEGMPEHLTHYLMTMAT